jgi:hypothetical protein
MTQLRKVKNRELLETEDRAIALLAKLPPDVAAASVLVEAFQLGQQWSDEYREILRQGGNPEVFQISEDEFQIMRTVRSLLPPDVEVDWSALVDLRRIFGLLPLDAAWWAAFRVTCRASGTFLLGERRKLSELVPDLAAPTPEMKNIKPHELFR